MDYGSRYYQVCSPLFVYRDILRCPLKLEEIDFEGLKGSTDS